jgi:glycosyltransferase involved in cell wall biosynthesis
VLTMPIGTYQHPHPNPRAVTCSAFGVPASRRLLVCFGDLRPRKGVDVAMEAARKLGDGYRLVIAGSPPSEHVRHWFDRVQCRSRSISTVRFQPQRLDDQALADLIHGADCVLLPYREILGSSALAACLGLGRAVVASDLPYFRETLGLEPLAGVLARAGDASALAGAVETFFAVPVAERHEAARRLGERLAWPNVIGPVGEWFRAHAR